MDVVRYFTAIRGTIILLYGQQADLLRYGHPAEILLYDQEADAVYYGTLWPVRYITLWPASR